jgi:hypothetical protein
MQNQNELTPAERELELALKSLRPVASRIDPVAAALAARRRASHRRVRLWQAAAAAVIVAVGLWAALGPRAGHIDQFTAEPAPRDGAFAAHALEPTTLLVYRRALAQSPAALEALLDAQVATGLAGDVEVMPASVFTYWNSSPPTL